MEICSNTIVEGGRTKCWLPVSPDSSWKFCRRCTWTQETLTLEDLVDSPYALETVYQPWFLPAFGHNERRYLMLTTLCQAYHKQKDIYEAILEKIQDSTEIARALEHAYKDHMGQNPERCQLFRNLIRRGTMCVVTGQQPRVVPEKCLECLVWALYTETASVDQVYSLCLKTNSPVHYYLRSGRPLSVLGELYNYPGGNGQGFITPKSYLITLLGQEKFKDFLNQYVLGHPVWYERILLKPEPAVSFWFLQKSFWDRKEPPIRSSYYARLKRQMAPLKEELIQKTWHPSSRRAWWP